LKEDIVMSKKMTYLISFILVLGLATDVESAEPLRQDPGPDGIVSIEAENFDENIPEGVHEWVFATEPAGFSGTGFMRAMPDGGGGGTPQLDFVVDFVKTGTHYVWVRGYSTSGTDDSCHAGLDGDVTTSDRIQAGSGNSTWEWSIQRRESLGPAQFEVASTGVHTVNVLMREDGWRFDKIVLTTNPDYRPRDEGPEESWRGARLKAYKPEPVDSALLEDTWVSLSWSAGETAVSTALFLARHITGGSMRLRPTERRNTKARFGALRFPPGPPTTQIRLMVLNLWTQIQPLAGPQV